MSRFGSLLVALVSLSTVSVKCSQESADFDTLVHDYWTWRLETAPEFATTINVHDYDDRVKQFTVDILEQMNGNATHYLNRLKQIKRDQLDPDVQTSYDVLQNTLETYKEGYKWKDYGPMNPLNFLEGIWTNADYNFPQNPKTYEEFSNYITRLYGWGDQALNFIKRMRRAIEHNTTNHWVSMDTIPQSILNFVGSSEVDCIMYEPMNETLDNTTLSAENKQKLRDLAISTLKEFRTKMIALKNFTETEYKAAARKGYGVSSLPNGQDFYKACLKWHLSTDITPEEVHKTGLEEVERISMQMREVLNRLKFTGTFKEFYDMLNNNSTFLIDTPEETIQRFEEIINDRVKPKLSQFFKNIPEGRVVVKEMPYDGPAGTYSSGSPDGSRPGVFYANVRRKKDNPTYSMPALVLHEVDPGHHMQDVYSQAATGVPMFRKVIDYTDYFAVPLHFPFYTAYTEGWGLYAESLGEKEQLDIYKDDYELMGRYSYEIFRACRLVVDTGLHYFNWDRDRAIEYMLNYTSMTRDSIGIEINRYITWPGQATAYKIGEIKIRELRKMATEQLGELFDIKEFHWVVLDSGSVPLSILERRVQDWIASVKASDTFEKIASDFWTWRMSESKQFSTSVGWSKYNDKLDSFSYEKLNNSKVACDEFMRRLSWINEATLHNEKRVAYMVLKNTLQTYIDGYKWIDYQPLNAINFMELWFSGLDSFATSMPLNTEGDFVNYVRRVEAIPQQLQEMMDLAKLAIQNGHTSHNVSLTRVPGNIDDFLTDDPRASVLFQPFNESADKLYINNDTKTSVEQRLVTAISEANKKFKEVKTFVETEYMPHTRQGLGISSLPGGAENYQACLLYHTSINITAQEVHDKGLAEVNRISGLIRQKMDNLGYPATVTISEMYQNLTNDPKFLLKNPSDTLNRFNEIIFERIQPTIHKYFTNPPDLPLVVRGSASDGVGGEYWTGTADGSRPGVFYANLHKPEYNPTYKMVSLSLHEALPGHHLAESYGLLADVPAFMKNYEWLSYGAPYFFPFYNAFAEGWALYAEYLGEEMGIYHDDYEMLGRYSDEMLRAVRLVVDTGIHQFNWSRDRAIKYMMNYTAETSDSAAIEIDRYTTWPGQACGYKIGELKIKELRKRATDALGNKFKLADFHYTVLRNGALPLDVLEHVIDEWITSQNKPTTQTPAPDCRVTGGGAGMRFNILPFSFFAVILRLFLL